MLLREAYTADVVTDIVDSALTGCQTSLHYTQSGAPTESLVAQIPIQLVESEVVERAMTSSHLSQNSAQSTKPVADESELTESQASHKPAKCLKSSAVGKCALAKSATAPDSLSKVVVSRRTSTRQIRTIKGTSKRVTFGSDPIKEDGPSNEEFEAVKDDIAEASSVEVLRQVFNLPRSQ